ncbi:MAG: phosphoribosylamine--glycine ligase [Candidatus Hydrogenedentes bacterium]|nr:phosphoribosylamine--glycine ligase [Candidatus Hydrogenedentota bacterium]
MNVLLLGSGGREHALAWKLVQSDAVSQLFCAPGNPGMATLLKTTCLPATGVNDFEAVLACVRDHAIDFVVVGPEEPLANGIADVLNAAGCLVFGPSRVAAQLEGSKAFAKAFMARHKIPTASYAEFYDADAALMHLDAVGAPIVIKADGLAAGKGVTVAMDLETARDAVNRIMRDREFGEAGAAVVIEEFMVGEEASIFALSDGGHYQILASCQDHKAAREGDTGPNTGGMGAYSPAPVVTPELMARIEAEVIAPTIRGMAAEGTPYRGVLYAGMMIAATGPRVVEFNCRFGDPETQVVLPRLKNDLLPLLLACAKGTLDRHEVRFDDTHCVTVVMASAGYPGSYAKGKAITGIDAAHEAGLYVFHAGTRFENEQLVTAGGRVLNVTGQGKDLEATLAQIYAGMAHIHFEGGWCRKDIAHRALARLKA